MLLVVGGGIWKRRSGLTPRFEEATVCGISSSLVADLVGTDRFVERYGFGQRCSAFVGGPGSEAGEVEFTQHSDDEASWPWRLQRAAASPHRLSFNNGRAGFGRVDDGAFEGTWVCSRYWPGESAVSVYAYDIEASANAFGKVLRAAADYGAGCAAEPLDGTTDKYDEPTACEMSADTVLSVLGTDRIRGGDDAGSPLRGRETWECAALTDGVGGEVGSVSVGVKSTITAGRTSTGESQR